MLSLLDEYRLILEHYYNDDRAYWTAITCFFAISGVLLSVFASTFFAEVRTYRVVFSIFGIILSMAGFFILVRIRAHRQSAIERAYEIESKIRETTPGFVGVFHAADQYGYSKHRIYRRIQRIPAFNLLLGIPLVLILIWTFLLIISWRSSNCAL